MFTFEALASDQSITYEIGSLSRVLDSEQEKWILLSFLQLTTITRNLQIFTSKSIFHWLVVGGKDTAVVVVVL